MSRSMIDNMELNFEYPQNLRAASAMILWLKEIQEASKVPAIIQSAIYCRELVSRKVYEHASKRINDNDYETLQELEELVMVKKYILDALPDILHS